METPTNEKQIRTVIDNWAKAVRNRDMDGILANHAADILMYDAVPSEKVRLI